MEKRERRDEILLLMAVSGEIPAGWVGYAVGSESYGAALLTRLKKEGMIKLRSRDRLRGYLLRTKGKQYLLEQYREDVETFLTGTVSTNHVKSEPDKRLRLHRMSMVWIACHRMGIRIFVSEKAELFPAFHPFPDASLLNGKKSTAAYYGTLEWKLATDQEIKGSRACGILLADKAYIVYNTMDRLMKWTKKTERNLRNRMTMRLLKGRGCSLGGAVLFGNDMELLKRLLDSDGGMKQELFQIDDTYDKFYYVPFEESASLQVRLLCDLKGQEKLARFLSTVLKHIREDAFGLEAGRDETGTPVYFCYLLELWQLRRIGNQRAFEGGRIFCFSYQASVLKEIFPEPFVIEAIRPEKVYQYLGWKTGGEERGNGTHLQDGK